MNVYLKNIFDAAAVIYNIIDDWWGHRSSNTL